VKGQGRLNRHIISESVLMRFAKKIIKIITCLFKLLLPKFGTFLLRHGVVVGVVAAVAAVYFSEFLFWGVMDKLGYKISCRHDWS